MDGSMVREESQQDDSYLDKWISRKLCDKDRGAVYDEDKAIYNEVKRVSDAVFKWPALDQMQFVKEVLRRMNNSQQGEIASFLRSSLERDFILFLPLHITQCILLLLDAQSIRECENVTYFWKKEIADAMIWKKFLERKYEKDCVWRGIINERKWNRFLFISKAEYKSLSEDKEWCRLVSYRYFMDVMVTMHHFYKELYSFVEADVNCLKKNWHIGTHVLTRINCQSESKGVYCFQYDKEKIISGLRDNTIKIWDKQTLQCSNVLIGHSGSVLCLQYNECMIISGSSDTNIRIWDVHTGVELNTLVRHSDAVLHLRFDGSTLVSCSKDRSVIVWDIISPTVINVRQILIGHRAAVNVVDFDKKYIVSASGDRTIKIWDAKNCVFVRTLTGHRRGIACLQYRDGLIVSGSSDNTIKIWDVEMGECIRSLDGHDDLVRCIRFDFKRIVSGAYDGKIKIWDMRKALDPDVPDSHVLLKTLTEHTGRVFRLQFDDFQMISSSHDDTILIWNFFSPLTGKSLHDRELLDDGIPPDSDDEVAQDVVAPIRRSPRHHNRQIFRERDRNNDEGAGSD